MDSRKGDGRPGVDVPPAATDPADLDRELTRRFREIYLLLDDGGRRTLAALGVTTSQYDLLATLAGGPEQGMPVSRVAESMLCTRGNISRQVARLAGAGLVEPVSDPDDQRLVRVRLTQTGRDAVAASDRALARTDERRFGGLSQSQRRTLAALLETVSAQLADDLAGLPAPAPSAD